VRPALKAGLLPVWRDRDTVQIGIDPRRAVALTGLGAAVGVLRLLDGSRDRTQVIAAASDQGVPRPVTERILTLLAAGGVLDDIQAAALRALSQDRRRALGAELAACALARGHSDAGATALVRRDAARVAIHGAGRVAAGIADILVTSGVGRVTVADGPGPAGRRRRAPARDARGRGADPPRPDLAILVGYAAAASSSGATAAGVPHLAVRAEEAIGVVGPLVRPGQTACLRCLNLTRAALDPAWPLILAQLARRTPDPPACDAALAAAVAAQAAAQALAYLDRRPGAGQPGPGGAGGKDRAGDGDALPAENGTLELVLPGWQWRRRTWPRHPACGCLGRSDVAR
jgi:hypothetical protein